MNPCASERYLVIACGSLEREFRRFAALSGRRHDFRFLGDGLHRTPGLLRESLQQAVDSTPDDYSAVLVGYGLCGNGIEGITARRCPLVFMRGHDCVTFLLGSRERYDAYIARTPGVYWYTPAWIEGGFAPGEELFARLFREYTERYGGENARYLIGVERDALSRYTTAAYIDTGADDTASLREHALECARWLGWEYDDLAGDSRLMRDFFDGNWDSADFLVLMPGETVAVTHDSRVIAARKSV